MSTPAGSIPRKRCSPSSRRNISPWQRSSVPRHDGDHRFRARADLTEIGDHIALGNPMRAFTFIDELEARCATLDPHPQRFPIVGRFGGRPVHKLSHAAI
ncbi:type II toxin-antitoxin system RelE/ParE family toxin [Sphingomonas sp. PB4P5]|uniref:type II toxin-antitoxin system RelE/ParE family toxin n=1 Tax=Parasphingomonas puruogangriensis TaxID=3096155 RepID=UPI002FCB1583